MMSGRRVSGNAVGAGHKSTVAGGEWKALLRFAAQFAERAAKCLTSYARFALSMAVDARMYKVGAKVYEHAGVVACLYCW